MYGLFDITHVAQTIFYCVKKKLGDYLPLSGGTLKGNLTGQYITGTWLQGTASNHHPQKQNKVAVFDNSGWLYHRTLSEIKSDMEVSSSDLTDSTDLIKKKTGVTWGDLKKPR